MNSIQLPPVHVSACQCAIEVPSPSGGADDGRARVAALETIVPPEAVSARRAVRYGPYPDTLTRRRDAHRERSLHTVALVHIVSNRCRPSWTS